MKNNTLATINGVNNYVDLFSRGDSYELEPIEKVVDGETVKETITVMDKSEKRAIDIVDTIRNINKVAPAMQCCAFAFIKSVGTWKDNGVKKFSDYARAINPELSANTINKYTAIGECFFLPSLDEITPVDERLKNVSISNLDCIISTFKKYADNTEIDGAVDYRDYVPSFLDKWCTDSEEGKAALHLKAGQTQLKEEVAKLNGKPSSKKSDKSEKKSDNSEDDTLSIEERLILDLHEFKEHREDTDNILMPDDVFDALIKLMVWLENPEGVTGEAK